MRALRGSKRHRVVLCTRLASHVPVHPPAPNHTHARTRARPAHREIGVSIPSLAGSDCSRPIRAAIYSNVQACVSCSTCAGGNLVRARRQAPGPA
eukprot:3471561-Prymnesium_polylepis.2